MSTRRSVVHTANFLAFGAQQIAVTLVIPGLGWVRDSICFSCIVGNDFGSNQQGLDLFDQLPF